MFNIEWLTKVFPNYRSGNANNIKTKITSVNTDSRIEKTKSLFIPLVGDNFDGHEYAIQAINNGAVAVFWEKDKSVENLSKEITIFYVDDTLEALQLLALEYRNEINPKVIGITGSNGKTTTKDLLNAVLSKKYIITATEGNYNNHIGLPLTILNMKANTQVLILEMGMSDFGEIELLSKIAKPDIAIITNIGESHIEYLGSREGISQAKLEITKYMNHQSILIVDGDEPLLKTPVYKGKVIKCGYSDSNQYFISNVQMTEDKTMFFVNDERFEIPLLGKHNAQNTSFVLAAAKELNLENETIQKGLNETKVTHMRFELIKGKHDVTLINDAYNASPTSMKASIDVVEELEGFNEKILVLGDILELGIDYEKYYLDISEKIMTTHIRKVYTYGEHSRIITDHLQNHTDIEAIHMNEKEKLVKNLEKELEINKLIFFKASRGIKLEEVINELK